MQDALVEAIRAWPDDGLPHDPKGLLVTVAKRGRLRSAIDQPGDVATVLRVLFPVFNGGYSGDVDLAAEAIRLTRQLGSTHDVTARGSRQSAEAVLGGSGNHRTSQNSKGRTANRPATVPRYRNRPLPDFRSCRAPDCPLSIVSSAGTSFAVTLPDPADLHPLVPHATSRFPSGTKVNRTARNPPAHRECHRANRGGIQQLPQLFWMLLREPSNSAESSVLTPARDNASV